MKSLFIQLYLLSSNITAEIIPESNNLFAAYMLKEEDLPINIPIGTSTDDFFPNYEIPTLYDAFPRNGTSSSGSSTPVVNYYGQPQVNIYSNGFKTERDYWLR